MKEFKAGQKVWLYNGEEAPSEWIYSYSTKDKVSNCIYPATNPLQTQWAATNVLFASEQDAWCKYAYDTRITHNQLLKDVAAQVAESGKKLTEIYVKAWGEN